MRSDFNRILFVEDDPDVQLVAKTALEAVGGFRVLACSSGAEALAHCEEFSPQLVLLDVMMPGMDGPTTLAALRQAPSLREVPVIFMTARVQAQEIASYRQLGAADVIAKPFDPMALSDQIRAIWRRLPPRPRDGAAEDDALRESFAGRLQERLCEIEEVWQEVRRAGWAGEAPRRLHRLAHSLAGAGGTFGFPAVTVAARRLEKTLQPALEGTAPSPAETSVEELLAGLRRAADEPAEDLGG